jgi:hypothetical protein
MRRQEAEDLRKRSPDGLRLELEVQQLAILDKLFERALHRE